SCARRSTASTGFRWSSPIIPRPYSETRTGRSQPGMTSVSSDNFSIADPYVGRTAPWSQEAEQAVLAAMMLDQDAALRAAELVDDTMFYREGHRRLYRAMLGLTERRVVIDHITLRDELLRRGELESAGGLEYLADLVDAVPTAANLEFHAKIVRDKAILR